MPQTNAERAVLESIVGDGSELSPEGSASVQLRRGTYYIALPREKVEAHGVKKGEKIHRAYHPPTGCLVIPLGDVDLFGV